MANNKEDAGKGMPFPGEMPASRRPYATIDARATEVEGREPGTGAAKTAATASAQSAAKAEAKPSEPQPKTSGPPGPGDAGGGKLAATLASLRGAVRVGNARQVTAVVPPPAPEHYAQWVRLAECESGSRWSYNGGSGYDGGLQFSRRASVAA